MNEVKKRAEKFRYNLAFLHPHYNENELGLATSGKRCTNKKCQLCILLSLISKVNVTSFCKR